jgi:hypothetical protein
MRPLPGYSSEGDRDIAGETASIRPDGALHAKKTARYQPQV